MATQLSRTQVERLGDRLRKGAITGANFKGEGDDISD